MLPGPFPIAARKTYGHVSDGMIASAKELGLGEEHTGILRLVELGIDAPVGTDAIALLGLDDVAVDINVTPDRGYALSIRGVAREYSHATGAAFRDPGAAARGTRSQPGSGLPDRRRRPRADPRPRRRVRVRRRASCATSTRPSPTPAWMVARLTLAGIRSLGILIDITNYVMLELGQPIHGYDLDKLQGGITVRRATPGEKLETLDGKVRTLDPEDLLITDESGPIGLAGVMGGGTTEMGAATRNVLIEAATFDTGVDRAHRAPAQAAVRGIPPLRARRRPARSRSSPPAASPTSWSSTPAARTTTSSAARCSPSVRDRRHRRCRAASSQGLIGVDYTRRRDRRRAAS